MDGISFGPLVGPSSLVMVLLGASGAGLMAYRKSDLSVIPKALIYSMKGNPPEPGDAIDQLALLSEVARKEGMLAVEGKLADLSGPFLRQGMQLVVDGLDAEQSPRSCPSTSPRWTPATRSASGSSRPSPATPRPSGWWAPW
jgi:chemotaxis protein MotA